jgi:hypothetical protein
VLALGDYDGDKKTDRAIVDRASGNWYVICSGSGNGCNGAIPWGWHWEGQGTQHTLALGDYDGDKKTDRAIVDRASGNWYVICSGSGNGCNGVIPWGWHWEGQGTQHTLALGDYDGDLKSDRAIVDRGAGRWYVLGSTPFRIY